MTTVTCEEYVPGVVERGCWMSVNHQYVRWLCDGEELCQ